MRVLELFRIFILFSVSLLLPLNVSANDSETTSLLLFGDSIIAGYGVQKHESLPQQLQAALNAKGINIKVINGGVSGDTTSGGRNRLSWTLKKYQPDLVVLALGGNDLLRGVSPQVTRANIRAMLQTLQQQKVKTILSRVQAPASLGQRFQQDFDRIYTDASNSYNVPLYPFLLAETYGRPSLMQADGIHPNPAGAALIASRLAGYLMPQLR
jgi:acyl-CoA thioesterase-1